VNNTIDSSVCCLIQIRNRWMNWLYYNIFVATCIVLRTGSVKIALQVVFWRNFSEIGINYSYSEFNDLDRRHSEFNINFKDMSLIITFRGCIIWVYASDLLDVNNVRNKFIQLKIGHETFWCHKFVFGPYIANLFFNLQYIANLFLIFRIKKWDNT